MRALSFFLLFLPIFFLSACAKMAIFDQEGYEDMAKRMPKELTSRSLPSTHADVENALQKSKEAYGRILFNQLSPEFMHGETAQYYIGETFAETMQPQRSRVRHKENGFIIEHVSQRITVSMLAKADWNGDGDMEWIVSCTVVPKKGGHTKTWYLLVPPPENKEEILQGTPCALWDCFGQSCTLSLRDASKIRRTVKENTPLTEVKEFVPGEKTITTPPSEKTGNSALQERAL